MGALSKGEAESQVRGQARERPVGVAEGRARWHPRMGRRGESGWFPETWEEGVDRQQHSGWEGPQSSLDRQVRGSGELPGRERAGWRGLRRPCTPQQLRLCHAASGDELDAAMGWIGETEAGGQGWAARAGCAGKDSRPNPALPKPSLVLSQCSRWDTWLREEPTVMKLEKGRAGI